MSDIKYASLLAIREFTEDQNITVFEPKDFFGTPVEGHIKSLSAFARDKQRALSLLRIRNTEYLNPTLNPHDQRLTDLIENSYMRFSTTEAYDARCISIAYKEVGHFSYDFGLAVTSSSDQYNKYLGRNLAATRLEDSSSPFCWRVDIKETDTDRSIKIYSRVEGKLLYRDEVIVPLEDLEYGTGECPNVRSITKVIYQILSCLREIPWSCNLFSWREYERRDIEFRRYPKGSSNPRSPSFAKEHGIW